MLASCPSLPCICRIKPASCGEAEGLVTSCAFQDLLQYSDCALMCSQLRYETAANQPTLVEIELLATVGRKWAASLSAVDVC